MLFTAKPPKFIVAKRWRVWGVLLLSAGVATGGALKAKLPGAAWQTFSRDQSFVVPARSSFDVEAAADTAYICYYRK